ncbi:hypothetical protein B0T26DRAFT_699790 [Lasiosphaeria miniovina]|uniref:Uncharacterized protein n=1 Tax=Lasiosphaeria miniovina TaxID=1954250 RepID=A0AA40ATA1_9PEZI|nr:uncharacterized protein B0T26DRAFT_699790 [Lasiosphaeria miniovina]KAK0721599.1 hypothetical protein B0T26DRAFT_699790 [Lasiosphaeria miniovina]
MVGIVRTGLHSLATLHWLPCLWCTHARNPGCRIHFDGSEGVDGRVLCGVGSQAGGAPAGSVAGWAVVLCVVCALVGACSFHHPRARNVTPCLGTEQTMTIGRR